MKRDPWVDTFIREDEDYQRHDEEVCYCACCGQPIYYGDYTVGLTDRTTQIILCEECADQKMSLTEWLDVLQLNYYEGEAGKVERHTLGDAHEYAKRLADGRTV